MTKIPTNIADRIASLDLSDLTQQHNFDYAKRRYVNTHGITLPYLSASLHIRAELDDDPDVSWLGEFTDVITPGCVLRETGELLGDEYTPDEDADGNEIPPPADVTEAPNGRYYYVLARSSYGVHVDRNECCAFVAGNYPHPQPDEYRYVLQDWRRLETLCRGDWSFYGIIVSLSLDDRKATLPNTPGHYALLDPVEIAHASLWGIESDSDDSYIREIVSSLVADCLAQVSLSVPATMDALQSLIQTEEAQT